MASYKISHIVLTIHQSCVKLKKRIIAFVLAQAHFLQREVE